ncbi:Crp/Fnr family transcriptional regulator [Streptomyces sp. NBC_00654]|uniref:Crp/Fnr family transcriptional regulator n=1 Tax=Streptomyces sp. NBC_00654 TaxID=2975799 RepID=UPI00338D965E
MKVAQINECGVELTLSLRGPGEVLGEMGALLGLPRSSTVTAVRPCTGFVLPAHAFRGYIERHRLETVVYQLTVERLNSHERLRADLAHLPRVARMARIVSHLADEIGHPHGDDGLVVELGIARTELATMVSMSRSSALDALSQLQAAGVLTLGRRDLVINRSPPQGSRPGRRTAPLRHRLPGRHNRYVTRATSVPSSSGPSGPRCSTKVALAAMSRHS